MNAMIEYIDPAVEEVKRIANLVLSLRDQVFKDKQDYGIIPGTDKPTLLLPGMEKLMRALNLRAEYLERHVIRDFARPLFHFEYECRLVEIDSNRTVSTAVGSANSMESKWRWRNADRVCPHCGKPTIIKGKAEYGGGWLCFAKKGGCGAKFSDTDVLITSQQVGRIENPDIFDQVNTISKIAQKRALGSAIKSAANVSEFYTVDLEDFQMYDVAPAPQMPVVDGRMTVEPAPITDYPSVETVTYTPAPPPPAAADKRKVAWAKFAAYWNKEKKLNNAKLCEILGVADLLEYDGNFQDANREVLEWLAGMDEAGNEAQA